MAHLSMMSRAPNYIPPLPGATAAGGGGVSSGVAAMHHRVTGVARALSALGRSQITARPAAESPAAPKSPAIDSAAAAGWISRAFFRRPLLLSRRAGFRSAARLIYRRGRPHASRLSLALIIKRSHARDSRFAVALRNNG